MKARNLVYIGVVLLFSTAALHAQSGVEMKRFNVEGVAFDYPTKWTLKDESSAGAQEVILSRSESDAQLKVTIYRRRLSTPEKIADAHKQFVDPYVELNVRTFQQMGANPRRSPAATTVSGVNAEGVKIAAVLSGEPGAVLIYWVVLGERLVVFTFFGPDAALKQAAPLLDTVRESMLIVQPPTAKPPK